MDSLPFELYEFIFRELDFSDLFNVSLVSKKYRNLILDLKFKKLVFQSEPFSYGPVYEPVEPVKIKYDLMLLKSKQFNFENDLKYLKICSLNNESDLNLLNQLNQLIHLEIYFRFERRTKATVIRLSLANLKILTICAKKEIFLKINCPNLKKFTNELTDSEFSLFHCNVANVKFKYPHSIRYIKDCNLIDLNQFSYLEILEFDLDSYLGTIDFKSLPNLKRILIKLKIINRYQNLTEIFLKLDRLLKEKSKFKIKNLEIYLFGIKILENDLILENTINKLRSLVNSTHLSKDLLSIQINNYSSLADDLYWFIEINYSHLMCLVHKLPVCFFQKYNNIQLVKVKDQIVEEELVKFIRNCKNCKRLNLDLPNLELSESFYEKISHLELKETI